MITTNENNWSGESTDQNQGEGSNSFGTAGNADTNSQSGGESAGSGMGENNLDDTEGGGTTGVMSSTEGTGGGDSIGGEDLGGGESDLSDDDLSSDDISDDEMEGDDELDMDAEDDDLGEGGDSETTGGGSQGAL